jgi:hypothetical protein
MSEPGAVVHVGSSPREMAQQFMEEYDEFKTVPYWQRVCVQFEANALSLEARMRTCKPAELEALQAEARAWRAAAAEPVLLRDATVSAYMRLQEEFESKELPGVAEDDEHDDDF